MDVTAFFGAWSRVDASQHADADSLEVLEDYLLKVGGVAEQQPLVVNRVQGTLEAADGTSGMTYWSALGEPRTLLVKVTMEPWSIWAGKKTSEPVTAPPSAPPIAVDLPVDTYLDTAWAVRVTAGDTGGRDGDEVTIRDQGAGVYELCHRVHPNDPWKPYDTLRYVGERGAFESVEGHRWVMLLDRKDSPRRAIYAMYYNAPASTLLPFEDDGTGAWGAEDG